MRIGEFHRSFDLVRIEPTTLGRKMCSWFYSDQWRVKMIFLFFKSCTTVNKILGLSLTFIQSDLTPSFVSSQWKTFDYCKRTMFCNSLFSFCPVLFNRIWWSQGSDESLILLIQPACVVWNLCNATPIFLYLDEALLLKRSRSEKG